MQVVELPVSSSPSNPIYSFETTPTYDGPRATGVCAAPILRFKVPRARGRLRHLKF